tara:strand:+ start:9750 stop:9866 length:117 start_codon:yes stop_codon:yes gene_type:complete
MKKYKELCIFLGIYIGVMCLSALSLAFMTLIVKFVWGL